MSGRRQADNHRQLETRRETLSKGLQTELELPKPLRVRDFWLPEL